MTLGTTSHYNVEPQKSLVKPFFYMIYLSDQTNIITNNPKPFSSSVPLCSPQTCSSDRKCTERRRSVCSSSAHLLVFDNNTCRFSSTSEIPQSSPNQTFNPNPNQHSTSNHSSDPTSTSTAEEARPQETQRKRRYAEYQDEQARVLQASLPHVVRTTLFFYLCPQCV